MTVFQKLWITATAFILGVLVTTPTAPNLGEAITDMAVSPLVARIGTVTDIVEADNITVRISGSPVLVQASYLFPQYQPLLGDLVYVTKQDAQWFVVGTMSGPNNSVILNSSFEQGGGSGTPTSWTVVNDDVTAGTPTTNHSISYVALDGRAFVAVQLIPTGTGAATTRLISSRVPASPGTRWTAAAFSWAFVSASTEVTAYVQIRFLDSSGATISLTVMSSISSNSNGEYWSFNRTTFDPYVSAPAGTEFVVLELMSDFFVNSGSQTGDLFWDRAILRGPV